MEMCFRKEFPTQMWPLLFTGDGWHGCLADRNMTWATRSGSDASPELRGIRYRGVPLGCWHSTGQLVPHRAPGPLAGGLGGGWKRHVSSSAHWLKKAQSWRMWDKPVRTLKEQH